MFFPIPGIIIATLTFPGVIVHELAHQLFCRLLRVPVYDVKYFQIENPCGYVIHEATDDPRKSFFIGIGPFLVNTLLGALVIAPAAVELIRFQDLGNPLNLLLGWLGFSILIHAFPSTGDAQALIDQILKNKGTRLWVKILVAPVIGLIYLGALGSMVWLDFIYAIGIAMLISALLVIL